MQGGTDKILLIRDALSEAMSYQKAKERVGNSRPLFGR